MKIVLISQYKNPHFYEIFYEAFGPRNIENYFFTSPPNTRKGNIWVKNEENEKLLTYKNLSKFQKDIKDCDHIIILGAFGHLLLPILIFFFTKILSKKIFVVSEGIKKKKTFHRVVGKILNSNRIKFLSLGYGSSSDFFSVGFKNSSFYKFGFFQNVNKNIRDTKEIITETFFDKRKCNFLCVGQLIERKNITEIIKAFSMIRNTMKSSYELHFVGEGPLKDALINEAKRYNINANFHGYKNNDELREIFLASDCYIISSKYDGWGVGNNWAVEFGLPIISSDGVRSAREHLVLEGVNGRIYKNLEELKEMIILMIDNNLLDSNKNSELNKHKQQWQFKNAAATLREFIIKNKIPKDGFLMKIKK